MRKVFALILAACLVLGMTACSSNDTNKTETSQTSVETSSTETSEASETETSEVEAEPENTLLSDIIALMESLQNIEVADFNAYTASFDDMVAYLQAEGVIDADAEGVDMGENPGYVVKYDGTTEDVMTFADKAMDYNGVYVIWFDLEGGEYTNNYNSMAVNDGIIPIMGGMYTVKTAACNGCFAIGFAEEYDEAQAEAATAALAAVDSAKPSLSLYSLDELVMALQKAKLISVQDMASEDSINDDYSYVAEGRDWVGIYDEEENPDGTEDGYTEPYDKTFYVNTASEGKHYGAVTIYYYNTTDSMFEYSGEALTWNELLANQAADGSSTAAVYYDPDGDWEYEAFPDASIFVDYICGNFAVSVEK